MNNYTVRLMISIALLLLTTSITIYSCHAVGQSKTTTNKTLSRFDSIQVFPGSKPFSYLIFRNFKEEVAPFESSTEQKPKSSFVRFVFTNDSTNHVSAMEKSKCNAFMRNDTLSINIGEGDGHTGYGVTVTCVRQKFATTIHRFFDGDPYYQSRLNITTEKQMLTLDKASYAVGDSVFGKIYVRQVDNEGLKSYAVGIFRAQVETRPNR